jgi:hypothetical protein
MRYWLAIAATGLSCAWLACAGGSAGRATPAATAAPKPTSPENPILGALTREAEPRPQRQLVGPDGAFTAAVRGEVQKVSPGETFTTVQIGIGTEAPATCFLYSDPIDLASALVKFSNGIFAGIASLDGKEVQRIDVGLRGTTPLLTLNWLYRVRQDKGPVVGQLKLRTALVNDRGILCLHDEAGYEKTFDRVVSDLLDTLKYRDAEGEASPYFLEISRLSLQGTSVGVARLSYSTDENGDTLIDSRTSLVIPAGPGELQAQDSISLELSAPDGTLLRARSVEGNGDGISREIDLVQDENGLWSVSGTLEGKEIQAEVGREPKVLSQLGQTLAVRDALAKSGASASVEWLGWTESDPTAFTSARVDIEGKAANGSFPGRLTLGPLKVRAEFLPDGTAPRAEFDAGGAVLVAERIHVQGSF